MKNKNPVGRPKKAVVRVRKNINLHPDTIVKANTLVNDYDDIKSFSDAITKSIDSYYLEKQKEALFDKVEKRGF